MLMSALVVVEAENPRPGFGAEETPKIYYCIMQDNHTYRSMNSRMSFLGAS